MLVSSDWAIYKRHKKAHFVFDELTKQETPKLVLTRTPLHKLQEQRIPASFMVPRNGNP